jgi:DNA-directed RNA polymerase subunit M/transcription elongation factor TFIIS
MNKGEFSNFCPLCGTSAIIYEGEISQVECKKCGKYKYHLSVHPLLMENEYRNNKVIEALSKMVGSNKSDDIIMIDLEMYQNFEKNILNNCKKV